jgi:nucleotide-binding universal stress UspA family protein
MYSRILLTTDGSHDSHAAVSYAVELALATGATVVVLEVIESPREVYRRASAAGWVSSGTGFLTDENVSSLIAGERAAAEHHLRAIAAELQRAGVTDVDCRIRSGAPGPEIVAAADEEECDTIVLATHGRSGIARLLLGSVADYVARNATCAVLLAPTPLRRTIQRADGAEFRRPSQTRSKAP